MKSLVCVLFLLCTMGCNSGEPAGGKANTPSPPKAGPDPAELLKAVRDKGVEKSRAGGWSISNVQHDARKSDSLVAPYTGEITFSGEFVDKDKDTVGREIRLELI